MSLDDCYQTTVPAQGCSGLLLLCTLSIPGIGHKVFPILEVGEKTGVYELWVSRHHGNEAEFIPAAKKLFPQIQTCFLRWVPTGKLRLRVD